MDRRNGFAPIIVVIIVAAVLALGGWYFIKSQESSVIDKVSTTTQSPATSATPIIVTTSTTNTSDWKTYRNERHGFEVMYPADWKNLNYPDVLRIEKVFSPPAGYKEDFNGWCNISFYVRDRHVNEEIMDWLTRNRTSLLGLSREDHPPISLTSMRLDSRDALKEIGGSTLLREAVYTPLASTTILVGDLFCGSDKTQGSSEFDKIIPTLKFIEPIPRVINTSNWKTYRSDKHGFEFRYPKGWRIAEDNLNAIQELESVGSYTWVPRSGGLRFEDDKRLVVVIGIEYPNLKKDIWDAISHDAVGYIEFLKKDLEDYEKHGIGELVISSSSSLEYQSESPAGHIVRIEYPNIIKVLLNENMRNFDGYYYIIQLEKDYSRVLNITPLHQEVSLIEQIAFTFKFIK